MKYSVTVGVTAALLWAAVIAVGLPAAAATLVADYQFQNTLSSSVGSPPAVVDLGPGTNAFVSDTVAGQTRTVLAFPEDNGLSLAPTTGVIPNDHYSVVILFRFDNVDGYRRILDFKDGQSDCGFYLLDGALDFYCDPTGTGSIAPDTYVQVVLTRDSAGNVMGYIDGNPNLSFDDSSSGDAVIDSNNTLRVFRDNECDAGACGEDSAGAVARIRLYDDA